MAVPTAKRLTFLLPSQALPLNRSAHKRSATPRMKAATPIRVPRPKTAAILTAFSATLGPLLDNYHSQFHILTYFSPLHIHLEILNHPLDVSTSPFTPPLFVLAGLIIGIGTLFINAYPTTRPTKQPTFPQALATISAFSSIYYLSASLPHTSLSPVVGPVLFLLAVLEWWVMDRSVGGLVMGLATAVTGPAVEVALIRFAHLYCYSRPEFLGVPLFIVPVYFAGAPAVGNLARAVAAWEDAGQSSYTRE